MPTMELVPPGGTPYVLLDEETADELAGNTGGTPLAASGAAGLAGAPAAGDERWTTYGARSGREKQLKLYRLLRLWGGGRDLGYGGLIGVAALTPGAYRRTGCLDKCVFWVPRRVRGWECKLGVCPPSAPG